MLERRDRTAAGGRGHDHLLPPTRCAASPTTPPTSPAILNQIPGPVLLVGHSYGGAVITNAGSRAENVVGLVYVAGFAPDEGETLLEIEQDSRDSVLFTALIPLQYPTGNGTETATEFAIDPAKIQEAFAADLPRDQNAILAATQRPIAEVTFAEPTTAPAWKTLPTWAVVPTGDKAVGTDVVRFYAERAGATIVEVDGSHVVMISQPQAVTDVIMTAPQRGRGIAVGRAGRPKAPIRPVAVTAPRDRVA